MLEHGQTIAIRSKRVQKRRKPLDSLFLLIAAMAATDFNA
jgi:hypothetical protein